MPFTHRIEDSILIFEVAGTYTIEDLNELAKFGPAQVESNSLKRVIFNFQNADTTATDNIFDIYQATEMLGKNYPNGTHFAIIPSSKSYSNSEKHKMFFENVAHNRAISVMVVPDFDSARNWLLKN